MQVCDLIYLLNKIEDKNTDIDFRIFVNDRPISEGGSITEICVDSCDVSFNLLHDDKENGVVHINLPMQLVAEIIDIIKGAPPGPY